VIACNNHVFEIKLYLPVLVSSRAREHAKLPSRLFPRLPVDPLLLRLQSDIGDDVMAELPFPVFSPNDAPNVGFTSSLKAKSIKFIVDETSPSGAAVLDMSGTLDTMSIDSSADRKSHTFDAFSISMSANVDNSSSAGDDIMLMLHAAKWTTIRCTRHSNTVQSLKCKNN